MTDEHKRHVNAQIDRLKADAERHRTIAIELDAQADLMKSNM